MIQLYDLCIQFARACVYMCVGGMYVTHACVSVCVYIKLSIIHFVKHNLHFDIQHSD